MTEVVSIDQDKCTGCGSCAMMCPQKILYIDEETNTCRVTDHSKCDKKRACEGFCPTGAIKINE